MLVMCVLLCNTREMGHVHTTHENPFHPFFFATSDLLCLYGETPGENANFGGLRLKETLFAAAVWGTGPPLLST